MHAVMQDASRQKVGANSRNRGCMQLEWRSQRRGSECTRRGSCTQEESKMYTCTGNAEMHIWGVNLHGGIAKYSHHMDSACRSEEYI